MHFQILGLASLSLICSDLRWTLTIVALPLGVARRCAIARSAVSLNCGRHPSVQVLHALQDVMHVFTAQYAFVSAVLALKSRSILSAPVTLLITLGCPIALSKILRLEKLCQLLNPVLRHLVIRLKSLAIFQAACFSAH